MVKPGSEDGYLFEEKNSVIGGRTGYAADSAYESVIQVVPPLSCFSVVWNLPIEFGTALKNMRYIRWLSPALI